jgi:hypothetical protein
MTKRYSWVTHDMFCDKLAELLDDMSGAAILLIPGVYEVLSEHLNNDVLSALSDERADQDEPPADEDKD